MDLSISLAAQYKTWCLYLLEHGNVRDQKDDKVKYIYGLPLRLPTDHMEKLSPLSLYLLNNNKQSLVQLLRRNSPPVLLQLEQKKDCSLTLPCARACFTFNPNEPKKVAVSILVHKPCCVGKVNLYTMLKQTFVHWLLGQAGLICTDFVMMYSIVNVNTAQASRLMDELNTVFASLEEPYTCTVNTSNVQQVTEEDIHIE